MSGNAKFKWFLLAPIVIALGSGCTTTPPPFGDPLDNMVAAQDKMSSLNISLGLIKSESVSIAINQINQIPGFVSSDDEDADASYLINNITQALKRRFKEIIFLDSVQELKHMNVDVGIILDLQVIFGRLAFQTTSVQINGTLIDEVGQEILRIASRGSKTIPFGSLDHGFKTATNKALKQFTETIDSDKFQASLNGIAETVAHRNREKQKSKEMILTKLIPMNAKFRIVEPSAKVRQAPFNQSRVVKKISMGSILQIIGKLPSGWMQVAKEGESIGWIHGDSVALDSTVPPSSRQQQARTIKEPTPQSGSGSGFFVSKMGHVITNAHVVQNCNKVTIGDNANKQVPAELINTDRSNDLALLKLSTLVNFIEKAKKNIVFL